eukprot:m.901449 g.901449  ORF g.901449 m.901449 type:complete len:135 (+) comp60055_c0_seq2:3800-4204(+)
MWLACSGGRRAMRTRRWNVCVAYTYAPWHAQDVALLGLANVLYEVGWIHDSIAALQMAIQLSPTTAITHFTMGFVLQSVELPIAQDLSLFFFQAAHRLNPKLPGPIAAITSIFCARDALAAGGAASEASSTGHQ